MTRVRFDSTDLSEFGYSFHKVIDEVPEHDYEEITIVGKDGTLLIDNKRMNNVQESYDIAIPDNSTNKFDSLRNFLASKVGYKRLEDDIRPNHYTKARFTGFNSRVTDNRKIAVATMNFERVPQRFLKSGDTPSAIPTSSESVTGNPVSIDNPSGLTSLTGLSLDIEPVQDLNGYDHPWVGGARKNKLAPWVTSQTLYGVTWTANTNGTITASGTAGRSSSQILTSNFSLPKGDYVLNGCPNGGSNLTYFIRVLLYNSSNALIDALSDYGSGVSFTIDDTVDHIRVFVSVNTGATAPSGIWYPMIRLATETDATYEPYENICPITGHTSATVQRTGKNLIDNKLTTSTSRNVTATVNADKSVYLTGTASSSGYFTMDGGFASARAELLPWMKKDGTRYIMSGGNGQQLILYREDGTVYPAITVDDGEFTIPNDAVYYGYFIRIQSGTVYDRTIYPMIRLASDTDDTYEPYQGNAYTIDLNGTIYGGTLDVLTGVLSLTYGLVTFDGSADESWGLQGGGRRCGIGAWLPNCKVVEGTNRTIGALSNLYEEKNPSATWASEIGFSIEANGTLVVRQFSTNTMTENSFRAFLQSNPMQICYPLQTPTTVQLTPQQVSLLTGTNIISTDMDSVTVTIASPAELENPTLFESKPIIRVYGNGTLNINDQYITVANSPYTYIDIDCELMDCYHGSNNANQYVSFSTTDYVTLRSGTNYFSYSGFTKVEVTPRWYEI